MERDSLKHSEFSPPSQGEEVASTADTDKKKRKKSQTDNERIWSRTNLTETKPEESKQSESLATWWRRTNEESKQSDADEVPETEDTIAEDQLDHLSQTEVREVAEAYLTARRQEIALQLGEQPEEERAESEAQAALAADTYLAAVENKLRTEPDTDISNATNEAYDEAVQSYAPESFASLNSEAIATHPVEQEKPVRPKLENSGGDNGREPPYWNRDGFPPNNRDGFGSSGRYAGGNPETVIERDFVAERAATVRGLLVGGIIGYLIGRRRGRIKTERRLIPIQKKLEREVQELYSTISLKETQLRKLVSQRERAFKQTKSETITANTVPLNYSSENLAIDQKRPIIETSRTTKPDTAEIISPPSSVVEVVDRDNLLETGEKITVGATTLRKVFETGLISERGLRRAVAEYTKGGDIRRILAEELLIKELGYELDPFMRDRPLKKASNPLAAPVNQPASHEQAAATIKDQFAPPADSDINGFMPSPIPANKRTVPPILITANVVALIVLAVLVLIWLTTLK